jgi:hypothetical protein
MSSATSRMCSSPTRMCSLNGGTISSAAGVDAGFSAGGGKVSDLSLKQSTSVSDLISRFQEIADQSAEDTLVCVCVFVCVCVCACVYCLVLVFSAKSPLHKDLTYEIY